MKLHFEGRAPPNSYVKALLKTKKHFQIGCSSLLTGTFLQNLYLFSRTNHQAKYSMKNQEKFMIPCKEKGNEEA